MGQNLPTRSSSRGLSDTGAGCERPRIRRGVIGVLQRDDRYLLIERGPDVALPGTWCFPGGHVERGESPRRAVIRELREELGIGVSPHQRLGIVRGRADVLLAVWRVTHVEGEFSLKADEVSACRWLTLSEIAAHPAGLPSNRHVLKLLE